MKKETYFLSKRLFYGCFRSIKEHFFFLSLISRFNSLVRHPSLYGKVNPENSNLHKQTVLLQHIFQTFFAYTFFCHQTTFTLKIYLFHSVFSVSPLSMQLFALVVLPTPVAAAPVSLLVFVHSSSPSTATHHAAALPSCVCPEVAGALSHNNAPASSAALGAAENKQDLSSSPSLYFL